MTLPLRRNLFSSPLAVFDGTDSDTALPQNIESAMDLRPFKSHILKTKTKIIRVRHAVSPREYFKRLYELY